MLGGSSLSFISPSANKIEGHPKDEHQHAVDGHDLMGGISYIVRIRTHSYQMPRKEGYSNDAYYNPASLHNDFYEY